MRRVTGFPPPARGRVRVGVVTSRDCMRSRNLPTPIPTFPLKGKASFRYRFAVRGVGAGFVPSTDQ